MPAQKDRLFLDSFQASDSNAYPAETTSISLRLHETPRSPATLQETANSACKLLRIYGLCLRQFLFIRLQTQSGQLLTGLRSTGLRHLLQILIPCPALPLNPAPRPPPAAQDRWRRPDLPKGPPTFKQAFKTDTNLPAQASRVGF